MDELVNRFKREARERFTRIERLAADGPAGYAGVREEAHKIKGAAGMLGFGDLRDRAAELEQAVGEESPDAERVRTLVAALSEALPS